MGDVIHITANSFSLFLMVLKKHSDTQKRAGKKTTVLIVF